MVAHDLKNPLHSIGITLEVLEAVSLTEEQRAEKHRIIKRTIRHMNRLIGGLLDMKRIEAGQGLAVFPQPIEIQVLLHDASDLFRPQIDQKRIRFHCEVRHPSRTVVVDPERTLQVFWNLIGNAVKFTPAGGTIELCCEKSEEGMVRFANRGSGPGIPAKHLDHLLDPFWQDKRTARLGTGLGLPIAKAIVEAHGARSPSKLLSDKGRRSPSPYRLKTRERERESSRRIAEAGWSGAVEKIVGSNETLFYRTSASSEPEALRMRAHRA